MKVKKLISQKGKIGRGTQFFWGSILNQNQYCGSCLSNRFNNYKGIANLFPQPSKQLKRPSLHSPLPLPLPLLSPLTSELLYQKYTGRNNKIPGRSKTYKPLSLTFIGRPSLFFSLSVQNSSLLSNQRSYLAAASDYSEVKKDGTFGVKDGVEEREEEEGNRKNPKKKKKFYIFSAAVWILGLVLVIGDSSSSKPKAEEKEQKGQIIKPKFPPQLTSQYTIGKVLGVGAYGKVYLATHKKTKKHYAVKIIPRTNDPYCQMILQNEVDIMEACGKHPNIVSLTTKICTPNELILIMDLVVGGELFERIIEKGRLSEREASKLMKKVCLALQHMHKLDICHNDIKPENLLLTSKASNAELKIADFGTSMFMPEPLIFDKPSGTSAYHAPEMILHKPCDKKIDMWAFGIVVYIMLVGMHPFDPNGNSSNACIIFKVCNGNFDDKNNVWNQLSADAKDLIKHLLDPNPESRYDTTQALNHKWFGGDASKRPLPREQISNLKGFRNLCLLRSTVLTVGASLPTNVAEARKFYCESPSTVPASERNNRQKRWDKVESSVFIESFKMFDKDSKGYIVMDELNEMFQSFGQNLSETELKMIVAEADLNGDGEISLDEFIGMMHRRLEHSKDSEIMEENNLLKIFKIFDQDGNGSIDKEELKYILEAVGANPTDEQVNEIMLAADLDGNGSIDYEEFASFLMHDQTSGLC